MQVVLSDVESQAPILIRAERIMSDDEFYNFCQAHSELRIERSAEGEMIVMPGTGGETGRRNLELSGQLKNWVDRDGRGVAFDSSTEFHLPNGAFRSPDASWIERSRWSAVAPEKRRKFPPLCPDFVVELRSASDRLPPLQEKMSEWIANGARLGWLIDADHRTVFVYRPGGAVEVIEAADELLGEGPVAGLVLDLRPIWDPDAGL